MLSYDGGYDKGNEKSDTTLKSLFLLELVSLFGKTLDLYLEISARFPVLVLFFIRVKNMFFNERKK